MKFVSYLFLIIVLTPTVYSQTVPFPGDEELEVIDEIDTEGLFDDELEPLDDEEIIRPSRPRRPSPR